MGVLFLLSHWPPVHEGEGSRGMGQVSDGHEYGGMTIGIKKKSCRDRQPWPELVASGGILELAMRTV